MRCRYCHNPETWKLKAGKLQTAEKTFAQAYRYRNYWKKGTKQNGGITVSGGEPLLQAEFVTELFRLAKQKKVHTALDTSGNPFGSTLLPMEQFEALMDVTDLVILDLKLMNEKGHKELTGQPNGNILEMARWLSDHGKTMWLRHVLVPGLTDDEKDLRQMGELIRRLKSVERVEVLPYHTLGLSKWEKLGIPYTLKGVRTPTQEEVERAEKLLIQEI